jgi:predicted PurR-regulated permease PerM
MIITRKISNLIALALLLIAMLLLYRFREVLPIFILALLLAYILTPLVVKISSKNIYGKNIPRGIAIIGIYLISILGLSSGGTYFVINLSNEMRTLINNIPSYGKQIQENWVPAISDSIHKVTSYMPKLDDTVISEDNIVELEQEKSKKLEKGSTVTNQKNLNDQLSQLLLNTRFEIKQGKSGFEIIPHKISHNIQVKKGKKFDFEKMMDGFITDFIENMQSILLEVFNFGQIVILTIVNSLFQTMIVLMITAFLIIDHELILDYFRNLFPKRFLKNIEHFLEKQNNGLHGVVRGQLIICLVNGTLTGIGLLILDVNFALTLSILATICSLIPIFGVIISSVPIVLMAITSSLWTGLLALAWILGIHFIEANLLNPKIIGRSAEIHPVLVIFALMAGERAFGLFGALIAVPVFSILQTTFIFTREILLEAENAIEAQNSSPNS